VAAKNRKPRLAVWKFASCDGCQLSLLDCEDELLAVAGAVDIAYFLEATRGAVKGRYDLSLVEGSITTASDAARIRDVRARSRTLVTIGACATAGRIQALRNWANVEEYASVVYARPDYIQTYTVSRPGHPCGLWGNLPVLRPRLLRLLWTDGNSEHALA
jgi:sulfhydrogenase subunit delta